MTEPKELFTVEEKHSAMDKVAGFTYQFFCFLYHLLTMRRGEEVSFEKWDDAAIEKGNFITLLQAKHTIASANGKNPKLTNRSSALWKAIDVWRELIIGASSLNRTKEEMLQYINEHEFIFVSNMQVTDNKLCILCNKLHINADAKCTDELLKEISQEGRSAKSVKVNDEQITYRSVQMMIDDLKCFELRQEFLQRISFITKNQNDIKKECIRHISDNILFPEKDAEKVFDDFFAEAVKDFFEKADQGEPLRYTFEEFKKRFIRVFQYHREDDLDFNITMEHYKKEFLDLICIKQLLLINDLKETDTAKIAKYASYFLSFKNHYNDLHENSRILSKEDIMFRTEALDFWEDHFNNSYGELEEDATEDVVLKRAKKLLQDVRDYKLQLCKKQLERPISNGAFYYFSDECLIGWHKDWRLFFIKQKGQDGQVDKQ